MLTPPSSSISPPTCSLLPVSLPATSSHAPYLSTPTPRALTEEAYGKAFDRQSKAVEADLKDIVTLRTEFAQVTGKLAALEKVLDRPISVSASIKEPAKPKGTVKRIDPVQAMASAAVAEFLRFTKQIDPVKTLGGFYPTDADRLNLKAAKDLLRKSASNPGTTTNAGWGAELTTSETGAWISHLEQISVFAGIMAAGGRPIPMGDAMSITYPHRSQAGLGSLAHSFVAQGATIPVKDSVLGSLTFTRKKAGLITVATEELSRVSAEDLRTILLEMIAEDTALMLDSVILGPANTAIAGIRPSSPWNNAANQVSAGNDLASIISDISWVIGRIDRPKKPLIIMDSARALRLRSWRDNMGWVFTEEMDRGTILGTSFLASSNVPTDQVFIIDADDFGAFLPKGEIDASQTASIAMADDDGIAPTMSDTNAVDDAGGSIHLSDTATTLPGIGVISMMQTFSTALRVIQPVEWGMFRANRTAYLSGVAW